MIDYAKIIQENDDADAADSANKALMQDGAININPELVTMPGTANAVLATPNPAAQMGTFEQMGKAESGMREIYSSAYDNHGNLLPGFNKPRNVNWNSAVDSTEHSIQVGLFQRDKTNAYFDLQKSNETLKQLEADNKANEGMDPKTGLPSGIDVTDEMGQEYEEPGVDGPKLTIDQARADLAAKKANYVRIMKLDPYFSTVHPGMLKVAEQIDASASDSEQFMQGIKALATTDGAMEAAGYLSLQSIASQWDAQLMMAGTSVGANALKLATGPYGAGLITAGEFAARGYIGGKFSYDAELANGILEVMKENGVDITNPDAVLAASNDPALQEQFNNKRNKALVIGGLDSISSATDAIRFSPGNMLRIIRQARDFQKIAGEKGLMSFKDAVDLASQGKNTIGLAGKAADRVANAAFQTTLQAALGGAGEYFGQKAAGEETDMNSVIWEAAGEFGPGSIEVLTATTTSVARDKINTMKAEVAKKHQEAMLNLTKAGAAASAALQSNEAVEAWAKRVGGENVVFLDGRTALEQGLIEEVRALDPVMAESLAKAADNGESVAIKVSSLAQAATINEDLAKRIVYDSRTLADGMSPREADEFMKNHQHEAVAEFDRIIEKAKPDIKLSKLAHGVASNLSKQLVASGMSKDYADAAVKPWEAYLIQTSKMLGISPDEVARRLNIRVQRYGAAPMVTTSGGVINGNEGVIDRGVTDNKAKARNAYERTKKALSHGKFFNGTNANGDKVSFVPYINPDGSYRVEATDKPEGGDESSYHFEVSKELAESVGIEEAIRRHTLAEDLSETTLEDADQRLATRMREMESESFGQRLSTVNPGAKTVKEDPSMDAHYNLLGIDLERALNNDAYMNKAIVRMTSIPGMKSAVSGIDTSTTEGKREALKAMSERMQNILQYVYDKMTPEQRTMAKQWYDGGRLFIDNMADEYGISAMQAAAVVAVLSPQRDWFSNLSLAQRICDMVYGGGRNIVIEGAIADELDGFLEAKNKSLGAYKDVLKAIDKNTATKKVLDGVDPSAMQDARKAYKKRIRYEKAAEELTSTANAADQERKDIAAKVASMKKEAKNATDEEKAAIKEQIKQLEEKAKELKDLATSSKKKAKKNQDKAKEQTSSSRLYASKLTVINRTEKDYKRLEDAVKFLKGKTLGDAISEGDHFACAIAFRAIDTVTNDRSFNVMSPDGYAVRQQTNEKGEPLAITSPGFDTYAKAFSVLADGSAANVFEQLGDKHKVRNFYNNLFAPGDPMFATIDTHAVAAALFAPMSSSSVPVNDNFGGVANSAAGVDGTYPIYFDAYKKVAEANGVLTREMQSITWEAIRVIFTPEFKQEESNVKAVEQIWNECDEGKITYQEALDKIYAFAMGDRQLSMAWQQDRTIPEGSFDTYNRDAIKATIKKGPGETRTRISLEVAPDPANTDAVEEWNNLPTAMKMSITQRVIDRILPKIAQRAGVMVSDATLQLGGWAGSTNPSLSILADSSDNTMELIMGLGHALRQEGVYATSAVPAPGFGKNSAIILKTPVGFSKKQVSELYNKLYQKTYNGFIKDDNGNDSIGDDGKPVRGAVPHFIGHSTTEINGSQVMVFCLDDAELARSGSSPRDAYEALKSVVENEPGDFEDVTDSIYSAYINTREETDNGSETLQDVGRVRRETKSKYSDLRSETDRIYSEEVERAKQEYITERARFEKVFSRARKSVNAARAVSGEVLPSGSGGLRRILERELTVVRRWEANQGMVDAYKQGGLGTEGFNELESNAESASLFHSAITESKTHGKFGEQVYVYDVKDYEGMRLFITDNGRVGFAIKPDGDIVSAFSWNKPGEPSNGSMVHMICETAKAAGGKKTDCFDTFLPVLYAMHGAKVVSRVGFDWRYAPSGWNVENYKKFSNGEPDVVLMVMGDSNEPYDPLGGNRCDSYDDAEKVRQDYMSKHDGALGQSELDQANRDFNNNWQGEESYGQCAYHGSEIVNYLEQQKAGGRRGQYTPNNAESVDYRKSGLIELMERSDKSTFLHESAHAWLDADTMLAMDLAARIDRGEELTRGEKKFLHRLGGFFRWGQEQGVIDFGIKNIKTYKHVIACAKQWRQMDVSQQRGMHELFAEGFEAYLLEGKSPSMEMADCFSRFKQWLMDVYRTATNQPRHISKEVKKLYDLMFVGEQEAKDADEKIALRPLFDDAMARKKSGMTDEELAAYDEKWQRSKDAAQTLITKALGIVMKLRSALAPDAATKIAATKQDRINEVTKELENRPCYKAIKLIRESKSDFYGSMLISKESLEALGVQKEAITVLKRKRLVAPRDGAPIATIAEMVGVQNPAVLVAEMVEAKPIQKAALEIVAVEVRQELQENPDTYTETLQDLAAHEERRGELLAAEYNAVCRALGKPQLLARSARQWAVDRIASMKVGDVYPKAYMRDEAKNARLAEKAFREGDLEACLLYKRAQIAAHAMARAALEAKEIREKGTRRVAKAIRNKKVDGRFRVAMQILLDAHSLGNMTAAEREEFSKVDPTKFSEAFVKELNGAGMPIDGIDRIMASSSNIKDMTVEEARTLFETLSMLEAIGKSRMKQALIEETRTIQEVVTQGRNMLGKDSPDMPGQVNGLYERSPNTKMEKAADWLRQRFLSHITIQSFCRIMDGNKDGGFWWKLFVRSANRRAGFENAHRNHVAELIADAFDGVYKKNQFEDPVLIEGFDKPFNHGQRIAIALNLGNESNRQRLVGGDPRWTQDAIKQLMETLTEADWRCVEKIWKLFESYRPLIAAKEKRVYGIEPEWIAVEPFNVVTKEGKQIEVCGGYYPVKYDPRASSRSQQHEDAASTLHELCSNYQSSTTRRSFTKSRVKSVEGRPLTTELVGLYEGMNDIIHDLAWHEWLIETKKVLDGTNGVRGLREDIRQRYGSSYAKMFEDWRRDIAQGGRESSDSVAQKIVMIGSSRVGLATMGWSLTSALVQLLGVGYAVPRSGALNVALASGKWLRHPFDLRKSINDKSQFMALRAKTMNRDIADVRNGLENNDTIITRHAYAMLQMTQGLSDAVTWQSSYEASLKEGRSEKDAIEIADQTVIDTQSSGNISDQSLVMRDRSLMRLFTVFYSWANQALNLGVQYQYGERSSAKKIAALLWMGAVMPILDHYFREILKTDDGSDDDDEDPILKMLRTCGGSIFEYHLGLFVGLREIANAGGRFVSGERVFDYGGPAGLRAIDTANDLFSTAQNATPRKVANLLIDAAGATCGLPSAQIKRSYRGTEALVEGRVDGIDAFLAPVFGYSGRLDVSEW